MWSFSEILSVVDGIRCMKVVTPCFTESLVSSWLGRRTVTSLTASQLLHCQGVLKLMNAYEADVRASEVLFEHGVGDFETTKTISIRVTTGWCNATKWTKMGQFISLASVFCHYSQSHQDFAISFSVVFAIKMADFVVEIYEKFAILHLPYYLLCPVDIIHDTT